MRGAWRTPEREALMRAEYAAATDAAGFLARVEALPGATGASMHTLRVWARALGLRKTPEALAVIMRETQVRGGKARQAMLAGRPVGRRYVPTSERIAMLRERQAAAAEARAARPPKPAKVAKERPQVWSPDRLALLTSRYPDEGVAALLDDLRALPGAPIASVKSIRRKVKHLGLRMTTDGARRVREAAARAAMPPKPQPEPKEPKPRRQPHAREIIAATDMSVAHRAFVIAAPPPDADLTLQQHAERADAAMAKKHERARRMIAARREASAIAAQCALPLREVFRLMGEVRPCTA